jgi:MFS family permease
MDDYRLRRFLWLYPIAVAGAFVAFLPLLSVALPLRAEAIAGTGKILLLSQALIVGVSVATVANIAAGVASDWTRARFGTRIPWMWLGLALTWIGYAAIAAATTGAGLIIAVSLFQLGFNLLFAPLGAMLPDSVPDRLKGRVAAMANLALPAGSLASALIGFPLFATDTARIVVPGCIATLLILPVLLSRARHAAEPAQADDAARGEARLRWSAFCTLWGAKFLVQLSGSVMTGYFLFYLKDGLDYEHRYPGGSAQSGLASIIIVATLATALASIGAGRWSDRIARRKPFLVGGIVSMAIGLVLLATQAGWASVVIGYTAFASGLGAFLTIDAALVAQILPSPRHRGRDLGLMNAANTVPAILGPLAALFALDGLDSDYRALFALLLGALALGAGLIAFTQMPGEAPR